MRRAAVLTARTGTHTIPWDSLQGGAAAGGAAVPFGSFSSRTNTLPAEPSRPTTQGQRPRRMDAGIGVCRAPLPTRPGSPSSSAPDPPVPLCVLPRQ